MADVTERLPYAISKKMASTVDIIQSRNGREIDYTVAGIPFRLRIAEDSPLSLETAPVQKNQQDTEPEAGEQTLAGWWLRSQASWHEGAGARYAEARGEVKESFRYWDSLNVDPWTPGELKLLKRAVEVSSSLNRSVAIVPTDSGDTIVVGQSGAVRKITGFGGGATADLYIGAGVSFDCVVATEAVWFAAGNNGRVYSGPTTGVTASPAVWSLTGANTSKPTRIFWAKHRLWAINGNKIYDINYQTPGTPGAPAATGEAYHHPSTSWEYTDICDAPGGILFSGHGDGTSHLQRITLDADGAVPTLSAATTTAILPSDEKALRISSLTGSLVCILTSRGVRVAAAQTSGELVYGPLFLERDADLSPAAKPALTSAGRFWWVVWGDGSTVYRIDSSVEVEEGVFAYAADMNAPASTSFVGVAVRGDRPVVVTSSGGLVYRHATQLEAEGWIQSGRIRFRTEEPKLFQFVDVSAAPLQGTITLDVLNEADSEVRLIQWSKPGLGTLPTAQVKTEVGPLRFLSVKLTLTRASDSISGPEVHGWQVKALPAVKTQRIYTLPLKCYDNEKWSSGQEDTDGYDGFARDRYYSLRAAEDAGGVVMLRDYRFESPAGELCKLEGMKFVQTAPGTQDKLVGNFGGILLVTLRTLT